MTENKKEYLKLDVSAIKSVEYIETSEEDVIKLIIITAERMTDAHLEINGEVYEAFTNRDEPYDFTVHGFFLSRSVFDGGKEFYLYMKGRANKYPPVKRGVFQFRA